MATESLTLTSVINTDMTLVGASNLAAIQSPDDADTSYLTTNSNLNIVECGFSDPVTIQNGDTISSVVFKVRARTTSGGNGTVDGFVGDGTNYSSAQNSGATTTSYVDYTLTFNTGPTGAAWTYGDLVNLQFKGRWNGLSLNFGRITTIQNAVVTYTANTTPPVGGLALLGCGR